MSNYASSFRLKMQKFIRHSRSFREKKKQGYAMYRKKKHGMPLSHTNIQVRNVNWPYYQIEVVFLEL